VKNGLLLDRTSKILEVGSGCLRNLRYLQRQKFRHLTAVEISNTIARFAREYGSFKERGGRVLTAIPEKERFDFILATFVIEVICPHQRRLALLRLIIESLADSGSLILAVRGPKDIKATNLTPCILEANGFATSQRTFIRKFTVRQITQLLLRTGLRNVTALNKVNDPKVIEILAKP
jgi:SAM-dependent methyltransferase